MKRLIAGVCAVLAAAVITGVLLSRRGGDDVASVAGHPITKDELIFHLRRVAPAVRNAGGSDSDLRAQALAEAEKDKILLLVAREKGLVDSVDHAGFLAEVDAENKRRSDAGRRGEVVYGVTEFSPEEYYTKRLTDLTTALRKQFPVTEAEVRAAFTADPGEWSANATTYAYSTLVVPVPAGAPAGFAAGLQSRVAAAGKLADVAAAEPGARLGRATYAGGSGGVNAHDQDLLAVLGKLQPGQISAPVPGAGQITYYELDRRTVDEDRAFAEYSSRIRQSLAGEKLDRYLQDRLHGADIEVDTEAVAAIRPEDVE